MAKSVSLLIHPSSQAKSGLPSQTGGGLGKMDIEVAVHHINLVESAHEYLQDPNRKLVMGGKEVETEPESRKPPTFKKA